MSIKTARNFLILPICLLLFNAVEEVVVYKLQASVENKYLLTGILLLTFAVGFTVIGDLLAPAVEGMMEKGHKGTKKRGGFLGVLWFYLVTFIVIYGLYYVVYVMGPQYMLPPSWR